MPDANIMTQEEFLAELHSRFGDNVRDWAFVCPSCKDVASVADFQEALTERPRNRKGTRVMASDLIGQECIGRTLGCLAVKQGVWNGRGCDWTAFGLIPGPLGVKIPGGHVQRCFEIAPAPEKEAVDA